MYSDGVRTQQRYWASAYADGCPEVPHVCACRGLGRSRQLPEDDEFLRKAVIAPRQLFEPDKPVCRPTGAAARREPPQEKRDEV